MTSSMNEAQRTGISGITGKIVMIRHATDRDRVIVEQYLGHDSADTSIMGADIAVALENDRLIGFGILKKEQEVGCFSLFEDSRRKGIGSAIVKHLARYAGLKKVHARQSTTYFTRSRLTGGKKIAVFH